MVSRYLDAYNYKEFFKFPEFNVVTVSLLDAGERTLHTFPPCLVSTKKLVSEAMHYSGIACTVRVKSHLGIQTSPIDLMYCSTGDRLSFDINMVYADDQT